jgi:7-cyano-7-deazaguanine synthase
MWDSKADVVRRGERMCVPWEQTWSCYKGGEKHCGICPTCRARKDAFAIAHVTDPTEYEA